jgi:hypothetical protein
LIYDSSVGLKFRTTITVGLIREILQINLLGATPWKMPQTMRLKQNSGGALGSFDGYNSSSYRLITYVNRHFIDLVW